MIIAGVLGVFTIYQKNDRYYLGEELTDKTLVLAGKPLWVHTRKGSDYYVFKDRNYPCEFRAVEGAWEAIKENPPVKNTIEAMNAGDTIVAAIRSANENLVYNNSEKVRIIGLKYKTFQLIQPAKVEAKDRWWHRVNSTAAWIMLLIGIALSVYWKFFRLATNTTTSQSPPLSPDDDHHAPPQNTPGQRSA